MIALYTYVGMMYKRNGGPIPHIHTLQFGQISAIDRYVCWLQSVSTSPPRVLVGGVGNESFMHCVNQGPIISRARMPMPLPTYIIYTVGLKQYANL